MSEETQKQTTTSRSASKTSETWVVIADGGVNVREFDSFDAPILATLSKGDTFEVAVYGEEWVQDDKGQFIRNREYLIAKENK